MPLSCRGAGHAEDQGGIGDQAVIDPEHRLRAKVLPAPSLMPAADFSTLTACRGVGEV